MIVIVVLSRFFFRLEEEGVGGRGGFFLGRYYFDEGRKGCF